MFGVKIENMRVIGNTIKCMDMVKFNGLMVENTKGSMKTIKNMGKALFIGKMGASM